MERGQISEMKSTMLKRKHPELGVDLNHIGKYDTSVDRV